MNTPLYSTEVLRLAAATAALERLPDPAGSSEKRSPICGSRITVDVEVDDGGRISAIGTLVRACALGQASAALLASHAIGRSPDEVAAARDALTLWLAGDANAPPPWPGLEVFTPVLAHSARHASIRLAFEAAAEAAAQAAARAPAR